MMMTIHRMWRPLAAATALLGLTCVAQAQAFAPYDGRLGYQELPLSTHTYYVAFHGDRSTSGPWTDAAWAARAAQLCAALGSDAFVPLRYVDEPVLVDDPALAALDDGEARVIRVAGAPVYIPIFMPSGPRNASVDAPGKSGPIRCVAAGKALREPTRAVSVSAALESAKQAGVPVR